MSQPAVKFLSHFASYIIFIVMIITAYLRFDHTNKNYVKFRDIFQNYTKIMDSYSNRNDLKYHLDFTDFVIRDSVPTKIDIFISIWIIGIQK